MNKVQEAIELFQRLEARGVSKCHAAEIAKRKFLIEDSLSLIRGR